MPKPKVVIPAWVGGWVWPNWNISFIFLHRSLYRTTIINYNRCPHFLHSSESLDTGGGKTSRLGNFESQSWFSPRWLFCSLICSSSPLFDFREPLHLLCFHSAWRTHFQIIKSLDLLNRLSHVLDFFLVLPSEVLWPDNLVFCINLDHCEALWGADEVRSLC